MKMNGLMKRCVAMLLSAVMVFSLLPVLQTTAAVVPGGKAADNSTMDSWKSFFDPTNITTAHAGGIWTDKSVFSDASMFQSYGVTLDSADNFLIALSALASNSIVVGQTYAPTDTMFVLDVSNSMSNSALSNMVTATNNAIRTLLEGEGNNNRVGVVLYGTSANVLLPLDHYTGVSVNGVENFIELNDGNIRAARTRTLIGSTAPVEPDWWDEDRWGPFPPDWWPENDNAQYETVYLKNSAGNDVTTSVSTGGGTYIQGGLWKAWQEFEDATVNTSAAVKRAPAMVLMSDGAPTYSASDFDNVPNRSNWGTGSDSYNGDGFLTQLTAAYIKAEMAKKYGTTAYFYTLGLDVGDIAIAEAVLDPANAQTADIAELWTDYLALGTGETLSVTLHNDDESRNVNIDKVAQITDANYADRYFSAAQISDLNRQFQNIVNEISLSAGYYPTHLDDNGSNYSGYITFVDEIGDGMDVKHVKGIVIGDKIYTGELLARALNTGVFGTKDAPTAIGDEFVRSVKARLGLTDNDEVWKLLDYAHNTRKSLYFDANTGKWSNYLVWYGDANGEYLGYDEVLEDTAVFRNECYGMLGTADGTHQASDMMYVSIQVSTNLETGDQIVTFRIPASMLPVVTYQINIDGNEVTENTTAELTYQPADPIRLVYEVGVREDVSEIEMIQYAKEVGGKYYLYTNKWEANPDLDNISNNHLTYAYFEPGADNEHYYFTDDSVIYSAENTNSPVTSTTELSSSGNYYYRHYVFNGDMSTKQVDADTGAITVSAAPDFHFEKLSAQAITAANAKDSNNSYHYENGNRIVPKGIMHYAHSHDLKKDDASTTLVNENYTGTFEYAREQIVDAKVNRQNNGAHHYELMYLGNNGRLEVSLTQGILLTKQMTDSSAPDELFTFDIKLDTNESRTDVKLIYVDASGEEADPVNETAVNGVLQVQLKAGEAVYIYDIPAGTTYTVTEQDHDAYHQASASGATGTVLDNTFSTVTFTNEKTIFSELNISKYVTYLKGASDANEASRPFTVTVTLTRDGAPYAGKNVYLNGASTATVTDADGKITFQITDKDTVKITNIPVGVKYEVTESDLPDGYTWTNSTVTAELEGTVTVAGANAVLHNTYEPRSISKWVSAWVYKDLTKADGTEITDWGNLEFDFKMYKWNGSNNKWEDIAQFTVKDDPNSALYRDYGFATEPFDQAGTYYYRIAEDIGTKPGITYDRRVCDFAIVVTDTDLDGKLEIAYVNKIQNGNMFTYSIDSTGVNVEAYFTNILEPNSTKIAFEGLKTLNGRDLIDGEFTFELYKTDEHFTMGANTRLIQTTQNGAGRKFAFNAITYTEEGTYYYVVKEQVPTGAVNNMYQGVTYDSQEYKIAVEVEIVNTELTVTSVTVNGADATPTGNVVSGLNFTNEYSITTPIRVPVYISKHLVGNENTTQRGFKFQMVQLDSQGQPINNVFEWPAQNNPLIWNAEGTEGTIAFAFDIGTVGTSRFEIKEIIPDEAVNNVYQGITYDPAVYELAITTTDNGDGTLSAAVTMNGLAANTARFTNVYAADPVTGVVLQGNKTLTGAAGTNRPLKEKEFSFTLTGNGVHETVTNKADGSFSFSGLTFSTAGDYTFAITENNTHLGGVTYVQQPVSVTVHVADNGLGQLVATIDGEPVSEYKAQFTNTYAALEAQLKLEGFKELVLGAGADRALEAGDFTFTLTDPNHEFTYIDPVTGSRATGKTLTVANGVGDDARKIQFPTILYNAVGTHTYTITEVKQADGTNGVTYDKVDYTVTVEVTDSQTGHLNAKVTKIEAKTGTGDAHVKHVIDFFNNYHAKSVSVILAGNKVLENVTPGIAQSDRVIALTGSNVTKFPFSFQLDAVTEGAPMPNAVGTVGCIVQSGENGVIEFPAITFDSVGEYVYTVKELIPANSANGVLNGVTYTLQTHEITVKITDNKLGQLEAKVFVGDKEKTLDANGKAADALSFKNTYKASAAEFTFSGTKVLNGRDMVDGEFTFLLKDAQGKTLQSVTNKDGKFAFAAEKLLEVGTHKFTIVEDSSAAKSGITYDDTEYEITVVVKDNGNGQLKAYVQDKETDKASVSFTNTFTPGPVQTVVKVEKILDNQTKETMGLDGFKFQLTGEGNTLAQSTNKDGFAEFELSFDAADLGKTFTYQLTELNTKIPGMTYSEVVYEYKFTVAKDQATGELSVSVTRDGKAADGNAKFVNVYVGVEEPPKTGDDAQPMMMAFAMCISAAALAVLLFTGKKNRYHGRYARS